MTRTQNRLSTLLMTGAFAAAFAASGAMAQEIPSAGDPCDVNATGVCDGDTFWECQNRNQQDGSGTYGAVDCAARTQSCGDTTGCETNSGPCPAYAFDPKGCVSAQDAACKILGAQAQAEVRFCESGLSCSTALTGQGIGPETCVPADRSCSLQGEAGVCNGNVLSVCQGGSQGAGVSYVFADPLLLDCGPATCGTGAGDEVGCVLPPNNPCQVPSDAQPTLLVCPADQECVPSTPGATQGTCTTPTAEPDAGNVPDAGPATTPDAGTTDTPDAGSRDDETPEPSGCSSTGGTTAGPLAALLGLFALVRRRRA